MIKKIEMRIEELLPTALLRGKGNRLQLDYMVAGDEADICE
jgi:hypothetical protein